MIVELLVANIDHTWYAERITLPEEITDFSENVLLERAIEIWIKRHPLKEVALLALYSYSAIEAKDDD